MRLVVDASTVVAEGLRDRGRELLLHKDLDLTISPEAWAEAEHELNKRVAAFIQRAREGDDQVNLLLDRVNTIPKLIKYPLGPPPRISGMRPAGTSHKTKGTSPRLPSRSRSVAVSGHWTG